MIKGHGKPKLKLSSLTNLNAKEIFTDSSEKENRLEQREIEIKKDQKGAFHASYINSNCTF